MSAHPPAQRRPLLRDHPAPSLEPPDRHLQQLPRRAESGREPDRPPRAHSERIALRLRASARLTGYLREMPDSRAMRLASPGQHRRTPSGSRISHLIEAACRLLEKLRRLLVPPVFARHFRQGHLTPADCADVAGSSGQSERFEHYLLRAVPFPDQPQDFPEPQ